MCIYFQRTKYCILMLNTDQLCIFPFVDVSKAFDLVNRCKLLTKLENRGVAKYILRLISYEFISQCMYTVGEFLLGLFYNSNRVNRGVFSRRFIVMCMIISAHS